MPNASRWMMCVVLALCCQTAAAEEAHDAAEQATWLHAKALGRDLDGNTSEALDLLRQAVALNASDEDIAFDLARLAFQNAGQGAAAGQAPQLAKDARAFLALRPTTDDHRLLRAYILASLGQADTALDEVNQVDTANDEAIQLQRLLQRQVSRPSPGSAAVRVVNAHVAVGAEVDTNVLVLPEDATTTAGGVRINADAALQWNPLRGEGGELHLTGTIRTGTHVDNRAVLAAYDTFSAALLLAGQARRNQWLMAGDIELSAIFTDDLKQTFMEQLLIDLQALYAASPSWRTGLYVYGGPRRFVAGNPDGAYDRSGGLIEGELTGLYERGGWELLMRGGIQSEFTVGNELAEFGPTLLVMASYAASIVNVSVTLGVQWRDFSQSFEARRDLRIVPGARLTVALVEHLNAIAAYSFSDNLSNASQYTYTRHLASVGLEALW